MIVHIVSTHSYNKLIRNRKPHTKTKDPTATTHMITRDGEVADSLSLRHPSGYQTRILQMLMQLA